VGPNGAGKTTLFEMITGSNVPTAGRVLVGGADIHRVKYRERDRLAIHYHQSYQVRSFAKRVPSALLDRSPTSKPILHLFDEPQFNPQDGYIGFMLDFFRKLRAEGKLVFVCLHPTARYHLEILKEISETFLLVHSGTATRKRDFADLVADERMQAYLGRDMAAEAEAIS
jgi:ABC-type branched-subunit amino acid transport system ATPase component